MTVYDGALPGSILYSVTHPKATPKPYLQPAPAPAAKLADLPALVARQHPEPVTGITGGLPPPVVDNSPTRRLHRLFVPRQLGQPVVSGADLCYNRVDCADNCGTAGRDCYRARSHGLIGYSRPNKETCGEN